MNSKLELELLSLLEENAELSLSEMAKMLDTDEQTVAETKKQLEEKGFSADSVSALTTAMNTTSVLTGTAGEGKPNRKEDTEKISVGGFSLGGLLDDLTGKES